MSRKCDVRPETPQPADPSIRHIPLTHGQVAVVDAEDYPHLSQFTWRAKWAKSVGGYYAERTVTIPMHRVVINCPDGLIVDHVKPRSTLDNRKSNLRIATYSQNAGNRRKHHDNTSGYIGVAKIIDQWGERYRAYFTDPSKTPKRQHAGIHPTAIEAARARDRAVLAVYGEFAQLNFPRSDYEVASVKSR